MNPTQNLRNPSQLNAYNFKRRCQVFIHSTYQKTSLRAVYRALNGTCVPNPKRLRASIKLRRFLRANKTFTLTYQELADALGVSLRTVKREVEKAISNGDMFSAGRVGNNKGIKRATLYESGLYLEPRFSEVPHSISKAILSGNQTILARFQTVGAAEGWRNKTLLACCLYLKSKSRRTVTLGELVDALDRGRRLSGITEREFIRTIKNALKSNYKNPLSMSKLREWGLLQETMDNSKYHNIPLH